MDVLIADSAKSSAEWRRQPAKHGGTAMSSETSSAMTSIIQRFGCRRTMVITVAAIVVIAAAIAGWYAYSGGTAVTQTQPAAQSTGAPPAK
jgi:hypothetical protein